MRLALVHGLEGVSIARIAEQMGISKSGVAGHFESKEALQLAAFEHAAQDFINEVWLPNAEFKAGARRLQAVMQSWIAAAGSPQGRFLTLVSWELAPRSGPLQERVAEFWRGWIGQIALDARDAGMNGAQTVFRLHAAVSEAVWMRELFSDVRGQELVRAELAELLS